MKNEIILNGVSSKEFKGLIILNLPHITKPQMRTRVEEIDGRDGELTTVLGYSAYDKIFDVGLSYGYDVDDIISFFNSSGIAVFSNEPDKYYNYQIIEQIDFEKLIRFKKANVKMRVQPFKYSTIEVKQNFITSLLDFDISIQALNGITLKSSAEGVISLSGTGTSTSEFFVPISPLSLFPIRYRLSAYSNGIGSNACLLRLIKELPTDADSFGHTFATLQDNNTVIIEEDIENEEEYNYIHLTVLPNIEINFTLNLKLNDENDDFEIRNSGNYFSRPNFTIFGGGPIVLHINHAPIFDIDLGGEGHILLDSTNMNASKDGVLKNRLVKGDYGKCVFNVGQNIVSIVGNTTKFYIQNYSRWI